MQRATGYNITTDMQGHVQYTKLGTQHICFVNEEIHARSETLNEQDKIRNLAKILLALETEIKKRNSR